MLKSFAARAVWEAKRHAAVHAKLIPILALTGAFGGLATGATKSFGDYERSRVKYITEKYYTYREVKEFNAKDYVNMAFHTVWKYTATGAMAGVMVPLFPYMLVAYTPVGIYKLYQKREEPTKEKPNLTVTYYDERNV